MTDPATLQAAEFFDAAIDKDLVQTSVWRFLSRLVRRRRQGRSGVGGLRQLGAMRSSRASAAAKESGGWHPCPYGAGIRLWLELPGRLNRGCPCQQQASPGGAGIRRLDDHLQGGHRRHDQEQRHRLVTGARVHGHLAGGTVTVLQRPELQPGRFRAGHAGAEPGLVLVAGHHSSRSTSSATASARRPSGTSLVNTMSTAEKQIMTVFKNKGLSIRREAS